MGACSPASFWGRARTYEHGLFELVPRDYRSDFEVPRFELQRRANATPWAGWVHVDGTSAIVHADDELVFFDESGRALSSLNVLRELEADRTLRAHLQPSTAGTFWTHAPIGYFATAREGASLTLILSQGQRVTFDARRGARLDSVPAPDQGLAAWLRDALAEALHQDQLAIASELARLAGRELVREAVPSLLALERRDKPADGTRSDGLWTYEVALGRLRAQHALVRMGVPFEPRNALGNVDRARPADWRAGLGKLSVGMTPSEIVAFTGSPMFIRGDHDGWIWEYDVFVSERLGPQGAGGDYVTVRLTFRSKRLASWQRLGPAPSIEDPYRCDAR
ncbi:MAG: hypothetical protein U0271_45535 [Polyangiaceae bacterium]